MNTVTTSPHHEPIRNGNEYIESLRGRKLKVFLFGELVPEPVDVINVIISLYLNESFW
jgi:hypothetical protein